MNVSIFLTTRYSSTRLPEKHMLEINGETVTDILIKRLKKCKIPIIMCCPDTPEDEKHMKPIAVRQQIGFFMGETENIIKRHLDCAKMYSVNYIILSEGDDWLVCPETVNAVCNVASEFGFKKAVKTDGLPFGMNVIAYPRTNLENAGFSGDTGWGAHVTKGAHILEFNYDRPYRLSLDYLEDAEVMENVYRNCKRNLYVGGIVKYLDEHREIALLNQHRNEEYWKRLGALSK